MSVAVSELLYATHRLIGVLGNAGRGIGTAEISDGVQALNSMLDSWATERLLAYQIVRAAHALTPGLSAYQIGPGSAHIDMPRPVKIEAAGLIRDGEETPVNVLSLDQWRSGQNGLYYDRGLPTGLVYFRPVLASGDQLALYTWSPFSSVADENAELELAPGYRRAIEYNLALELAPRYPDRAVISELVVRTARESKYKLKALNSPSLVLRFDPALLNLANEGNYR